MAMTMVTVALPGRETDLAAGDPTQDRKTQERRIRTMYGEVITMALREATHGMFPDPAENSVLARCKSGPSATARHERDSAEAWLLGGSDDFKEVCALAGVNPQRLHDRAKAVLDQCRPTIRTYEMRSSKGRK